MSAHKAPNAARMRQIKASLIRRDGAACFYCRTPFGDAADAAVDHLVPQTHLPGWRLANLVLACQPCNAAKADTLPQALLRPTGYGPGLVPLPSAPHPSALTGALPGCAPGVGGCGMTVRVPALPTARRRFTGTVLVDVSGYVDADGWLTCDGQVELWSGLAGARGLRVRLEVGALRFVPTGTDALSAACECASVEVSGTEPEGVDELVSWLREGNT